MTTIQVILSADLILAGLAYTAAVFICLPLLARVHEALEHPVLQWQWRHIWSPLLKACMIIMFILIAYPVIFGITEAASVITLISAEEFRINHLINILFLLTLLFPLIPVIGAWQEIILPLQGCTAVVLLFSWLAESRQLTDYDYLPGYPVLLICLVLAIVTHKLAVKLADYIGHRYDERFNVSDSGQLFSECLILIMQSPVIVMFGLGLGDQLKV